ncbi:MAG: hypothetical protein IJQ82_10180 [Selenomonadaceae bacterium]|nr:hypothetical protein [Selenomonadaceae bacterium]
MESSNPDVGNIIRFRENGKIKYLETPDAGIKRAVDSLQSKSEGAWILKALRATMSFLRARYTVQNPDFAVANIVRDVTDAFIHNRQLNANPILAIIETWNASFRGVLSKDKDFIDWQANGGAQASFVSELSENIVLSQSGRSMRELHRVFLFSNAAIRGLDLWRETLTPF